MWLFKQDNLGRFFWPKGSGRAHAKQAIKQKENGHKEAQEPVLNCENLSFSYQNQSKKQLLGGLHFRLNKGEIGCLLGPSGSGKSTILKLIAGFLEAGEGKISISNRVVFDRATKTNLATNKRKVAMVFQDAALFPHLTVAQNIVFGLKKAPKKQKAEVLNRLTELLSIQDKTALFPHQLSGGEKQRVAIARALAIDPEILLLDEPLAAIDSHLRKKLKYELHQVFRKLGTTVLWVTHDQWEAYDLANYLGFLDRGHLLQWDSPKQMYHCPVDRRVAEFFGEGFWLRGQKICDQNQFFAQTALGRLTCCKRNHLDKLQNQVDVYLRPENVFYEPKSALLAKVTGKRYRGSYCFYTAKILDGSLVKLRLPLHLDFASGDSIPIAVRKELPCAVFNCQ